MVKTKRTLEGAAGGALPADGQILKAVLAQTADPDLGAGEMSGLVLSDVGLTLHLFRLINSAFYSSSRANIISMRYIVVLLGTDNVARALGKIPVISSAAEGRNAWLLRLLYAKASLAGMLASRLSEKMAWGRMEKEEAHVCAMLRHLGIMALWSAYPHEFAGIYDSRARCVDFNRFKRLSGWLPDGLAFELARVWNLPRMLRIVVCPGKFNIKRLGRWESALMYLAHWVNDYLDGPSTGGSRRWEERMAQRLEDELRLPWKVMGKLVPEVLEHHRKALPKQHELLVQEGIVEKLVL